MDDYGPTYITVVSEDGEEYQLEHIDTILLDKQEYMAFLPADMDEDDENFGYVFLKLVEENGEEFFCNIEDEEEEDRVYQEFMRLLFDDEEE